VAFLFWTGTMMPCHHPIDCCLISFVSGSLQGAANKCVIVADGFEHQHNPTIPSRVSNRRTWSDQISDSRRKPDHDMCLTAERSSLSEKLRKAQLSHDWVVHLFCSADQHHIIQLFKTETRAERAEVMAQCSALPLSHM
jgi:hypothetical protein